MSYTTVLEDVMRLAGQTKSQSASGVLNPSLRPGAVMLLLCSNATALYIIILQDSIFQGNRFTELKKNNNNS